MAPPSEASPAGGTVLAQIAQDLTLDLLSYLQQRPAVLTHEVPLPTLEHLNILGITLIANLQEMDKINVLIINYSYHRTLRSIQS